MERKLAAILAADVIGYSRLMEMDEAGTLDALNAHRQELINPTVAQHHGRIVKLIGDGALIEFASVVDAVGCALAIQTGMSERNRGVSAKSRIELRIAVHLGDIIVDGEDIYGDGVNVAARLEGLAESGTVILSEDAYRQVQGKIKLEAVELGAQSLKNLSRTIRAYRVTPAENAREDAARPLSQGRPSIAVLPFQNLTTDPEQEHFAEGIAEDLITQLSRVRDLLVIARNSTFVFKGRAVRVQDVARELGVRYVLEGSVRRAGKRIRVTAQLIDAVTGGHLWAERYDRELTDFFELQDEITKAVTVALQVTLTEGEAARIEAEGTRNLQAWEAFLQGRAVRLKFTKHDNVRARRFFEQALHFDPNYGSALIELSITHWLDARFRHTADPAMSMALAKTTLRRAEELIGETGAICSRKGAIALSEMEHEVALNLTRRAVELAPSDAYCAGVRGMTQIYAGELQGAIASLKGSLRLSPYGLNWVIYYLAFAYLWLGDLEQARSQAALYLERSPQDPLAYFLSAIAEAAAGRMDAARRHVTALLAKHPEMTCADFAETQFYRDPTHLEQLVRWLKDTGLPEGTRAGREAR
jgi:adenylate cyclase